MCVCLNNLSQTPIYHHPDKTLPNRFRTGKSWIAWQTLTFYHLTVCTSISTMRPCDHPALSCDCTTTDLYHMTVTIHLYHLTVHLYNLTVVIHVYHLTVVIHVYHMTVSIHLYHMIVCTSTSTT